MSAHVPVGCDAAASATHVDIYSNMGSMSVVFGLNVTVPLELLLQKLNGVVPADLNPLLAAASQASATRGTLGKGGHDGHPKIPKGNAAASRGSRCRAKTHAPELGRATVHAQVPCVVAPVLGRPTDQSQAPRAIARWESMPEEPLPATFSPVPQTLRSHGWPVMSASSNAASLSQPRAASPRAASVAPASAAPAAARVVDVGRDTAEVLELHGHSGPVTSAQWCPIDAECLASSSADGSTRVWRIGRGDAGDVVDESLAQEGWVGSLAWCRDGGRLATGNDGGVAKIWARSGDGGSWAETAEIIGASSSEGSVRAMAWSPDGDWVAIARGSFVRVYGTGREAETSEAVVVSRHTGLVLCVDWCADGRWIASGGCDKVASVCMVKDGGASGNDHFGMLRAEALQVGSGFLRACSFSSDSRLLVLGCGDRTARVWESAASAEWSLAATLRGHSNALTAVAWHCDGRQLCTGSEDRTVRVWRDSGESQTMRWSTIAVLSGFRNWIVSVGWSSGGAHLMAASADTDIRLWKQTGPRAAEGGEPS